MPRKPKQPINKVKNAAGADFAGSMMGIAGSLAPTPNPNAKPKAGETTGPQNVAGGGNLGFPGIPSLLYQQAGGTPNGLGLGGLFPGAIPGVGNDLFGSMFGWSGTSFVQPRKGSYATYRLMSLDPTLRLVRTLIWSPILASQWLIRPAEGVKVSATGNKFTVDPISGRPTGCPQKAIDFIEDTILPMRMGMLKEMLRYLESGWRPFERVYDIRNGGPNEGRFYVLKKLKPLLPEFANILHDGQGNYAGLICNASAQLNQEGGLSPVKSWICSHDVEAGNLYGLSRHEAAFDPWLAKQKTQVQKVLLQGKLSGNLPTLYYRPGETPMNGQMVDNYAIAKQVVAVCYAGGAAIIPTTEYSDSELQNNPKLAELAPWKLEITDAGNYSAAMGGFLEENAYQDKLMCRAWGWPERAAIEADTAGSRADSETHTASASMDLEAIDDDLAAQVSQGQVQYDVPGIVDELLRLNWGDEAVGSIIVEPAPLVDDKIDIYTDLLKAVIDSPAIGPYFMQVVDWPGVLDHLAIQTPEDLKDKMPALLQEIADAANAKSAPKAPAMVQGGMDANGDAVPPKSNGQPVNGKPANGKPVPPGTQPNRVAALMKPPGKMNGNGK